MVGDAVIPDPPAPIPVPPRSAAAPFNFQRKMVGDAVISDPPPSITGPPRSAGAPFNFQRKSPTDDLVPNPPPLAPIPPSPPAPNTDGGTRLYTFIWGEQIFEKPLSEDATVAEAKILIAEELGSRPELVTLLFFGKQLQDQRIIARLRVPPDGRIIVCIR
jgi:hypothetical protein